MKTYSQLSQEERYYISSQRARNVSFWQIAKDLGRTPSTVSRDFKRNLCPSDYYAAFVAHSYATARCWKFHKKSHFPPECWILIYSFLQQKLSPEQISNRLSSHGLFSISFQSIYRVIRIDRHRGGFLFSFYRFIPKRRRKRSTDPVIPEAFYKANASSLNATILLTTALNSGTGKEILSWARIRINASLPWSKEWQVWTRS